MMISIDIGLKGVFRAMLMLTAVGLKRVSDLMWRLTCGDRKADGLGD